MVTRQDCPGQEILLVHPGAEAFVLQLRVERGGRLPVFSGVAEKDPEADRLIAMIIRLAFVHTPDPTTRAA